MSRTLGGLLKRLTARIYRPPYILLGKLFAFAGIVACLFLYSLAISAHAEFEARSRAVSGFFPLVRVHVRDLELLPANETVALLTQGEARLLVQGVSNTFLIVETAEQRRLLVIANDRLWLTEVTAEQD